MVLCEQIVPKKKKKKKREKKAGIAHFSVMILLALLHLQF